LVGGVVCLSPGWNGLAYKVSHQTWGATTAAAAENVNLFVWLHTMIQILGRISRTRLLGAPPIRPFQLAFKKPQTFQRFIQFFKEFEAVVVVVVVVVPLVNKTFKGVVDRSNYRSTDLMKSRVQFILHWMGHTSAQPIIW